MIEYYYRINDHCIHSSKCSLLSLTLMSLILPSSVQNFEERYFILFKTKSFVLVLLCHTHIHITLARRKKWSPITWIWHHTVRVVSFDTTHCHRIHAQWILVCWCLRWCIQYRMFICITICQWSYIINRF